MHFSRESLKPILDTTLLKLKSVSKDATLLTRITSNKLRVYGAWGDFGLHNFKENCGVLLMAGFRSCFNSQRLWDILFEASIMIAKSGGYSLIVATTQKHQQSFFNQSLRNAKYKESKELSFYNSRSGNDIIFWYYDIKKRN